MNDGQVASAVVVEYDSRWPADFSTVRAHLREVADAIGAKIEHVGSTAVPGLAAKPVIDIDVVVPTENCVARAVALLERRGYRHQGDLGIPRREAFTSPAGLPDHHLYVVVANSPPHRDHVDLRDYLRAHPDHAQRYATEKKRMSELLQTDRAAYAEGKAPLVRELLAQARSAGPEPMP